MIGFAIDCLIYLVVNLFEEMVLSEIIPSLHSFLPLPHSSYSKVSHFVELCGLPISTYFSVLKLLWLLDNVDIVGIINLTKH